MVERIYNVTQAAEWLGISTKTVHRHLALGYFKKVVVISHEKRHEYLFTQACLNAYRHRDEKRTYNRRIIKGKHKR